MAVLLTPPYLQFLDNNGVPLAGGFVYTCIAGADTPKATYTDQTGDHEAANPVELDAYGRATIWISGGYRFKVYDSLMNLIKTTDHVSAFITSSDVAGTSYFQSFSGNASDKIFTTSEDLGTDSKMLMVYIDSSDMDATGYQIINPNAYSINGTSLEFDSAPASGTNNIYVFAPSLLLNAASASAAAAADSEAAAAASATDLSDAVTAAQTAQTGAETAQGLSEDARDAAEASAAAIREAFIIECSDETTDLTTGTAVRTFRVPHAYTITDIRGFCSTAPQSTSTKLTIDVKKNGSSILSTKLTFDDAEDTTKTATFPRVISDDALADDDKISIDILDVGDDYAGAGLKVSIVANPV